MELANLDKDRLEAVYRDAPIGPAPSGVFRGRFLCWLDTRGAKRLDVRAMDTLLFRWLRFGIDFDRRLWWFVRPELAAGRFYATVGPSRWRSTPTLRLRYDISSLPAPLRGMLYDEVKPLSADVCLGLGGLDAKRGDGDHFFFALQRQ
jgi:hypothetical protein